MLYPRMLLTVLIPIVLEVIKFQSNRTGTTGTEAAVAAEPRPVGEMQQQPPPQQQYQQSTVQPEPAAYPQQ
jgi:hypothetical protein